MTRATTTIGGVIGLRELAKLTGYDERAQRHRPSDPQELAQEIRRLHAGGLKPRDIAGALRIGLGVVLSAVSETA
jgi:hypothetical protein